MGLTPTRLVIKNTGESAPSGVGCWDDGVTSCFLESSQQNSANKSEHGAHSQDVQAESKVHKRLPGCLTGIYQANYDIRRMLRCEKAKTK